MSFIPRSFANAAVVPYVTVQGLLRPTPTLQGLWQTSPTHSKGVRGPRAGA